MNIQNDVRPLNAIATYNAAADHFDAEPLAFWERHGRRAAELAEIEHGDRILDVGCGTGASALPAAMATGPRGLVVGIDIAENMLARARQKAECRGLGNVVFRTADMTNADDSEGLYDVVISVFSIFFVPDMERQIARLWRILRPKGRLVVTVWGKHPFEPAARIFQEQLRRIRPALVGRPAPWERLTTHEGLGRMLADGGANTPIFHSAPDRQTLACASDWWTIAIGSGFRGEIDRLGPDEQAQLKARTLTRLKIAGVNEIETSALHAVCRKPA